MRKLSLILLVAAFATTSCTKRADKGKAEDDSAREQGPAGPRLVEVASSERQWTGIAISQEGRIFVNYPRWAETLSVSVEEITAEGKTRPFPNDEWNIWDIGLPPTDRFVCVQSVVVDEDNYLWILDPANPEFGGVISGGPKLVRVNLDRNEIIQTIHFDESVAPHDSYLNDVRIDSRRGHAYITDSGRGALVVVDVRTGKSRRVLEDHPSTKSENITLVIGGREWKRPDGTVPQVHADGIALDGDGEYLYYQALCGRRLYRIATQWLRDETLSEEELRDRVEFLAETGPADGIAFGPDGYLYLTALEHDAIRRLRRGKFQTVIQDPRIAWPDSMAFGPQGELYFTTSQIHLGKERTEPYRIFRVEK